MNFFDNSDVDIIGKSSVLSVCVTLIFESIYSCFEENFCLKLTRFDNLSIKKKLMGNSHLQHLNIHSASVIASVPFECEMKAKQNESEFL